MSRIRAFFCHFLLSALVVGTALAVILLVWYPHPYFEVIGAASVLRVLVSVDLVLGPLLTLIIYRPNKPALKFDMSVIALLQLSALTYGLTVLYSERPYYNVFAVDRFELLARTEVDAAELSSVSGFDKPFAEPVYLMAERPQEPAEYERLLQETLFEGKPDLARRPTYWRPYDEAFAELSRRARPLDELAALHPGEADRIADIARSNPDAPLVFMPIAGKTNIMSLVLDARDWRPVDVVDADPWEASAEPQAAGASPLASTRD